MLKNYGYAANSLGMHYSWQKTKLQNIGSGRPPLHDHVNGQAISNQSPNSPIYLGSDITSDGRLTSDVHKRIGLALDSSIDRVKLRHISMVAIRSPFCRSTPSRYSNKIESVGLRKRKRPYKRYLTKKVMSE